jgi:hypothetical protein
MFWRFLTAFCISLATIIVSGQSVSNEYLKIDTVLPDSIKKGNNELIIYVIPSRVKYDWTSPHTLYKTFIRNFNRNLLNKDNYMLGHAFMELRSPHCPEKIFAGMSSASRKEQKDLLLKQHYGLAILGADIQGKLETGADLEHTLEKYSRKGQLAFMSFFINDTAADRLIEFFQTYKAGIESNDSPGARYSGAFWPRYKGEGSGCSAFVVSFLDLAGLMQDEFDDWMLKIKIPMDLIGGPYNNYNDVRLRDIRKCKSWEGNTGSGNTVFVYLGIYDPSIMFDWINENWEKKMINDEMAITPLQLNKAKGIRIDGRGLPAPQKDSIFTERKKPSIFIDYYHKK